jgi:hypothetical protein
MQIKSLIVAGALTSPNAEAATYTYTGNNPTFGAPEASYQAGFQRIRRLH